MLLRNQNAQGRQPSKNGISRTAGKKEAKTMGALRSRALMLMKAVHAHSSKMREKVDPEYSFLRFVVSTCVTQFVKVAFVGPVEKKKKKY